MYDEALQEGIEPAYSDGRTKALLIKIKNGDEKALEAIVNQNMPLVKSIVRGFLNRGTEYDDLVQLGTIGLIKAARNYSFDYDVHFSTYAVPLISGEIKRFLRDDGIVKVSRTLKDNFRKYMNARERLAKTMKREPTVSEVSAEAGISVEDAVEALDSQRPVVSVYEPIGDDDADGIALIDKIEDENDSSESFAQKMLISELMGSLDENERKIIALRYFEGLTQTEVALKLSMTQVQVSRCEKKILLRLRNQITE